MSETNNQNKQQENGVRISVPQNRWALRKGDLL